MGWLIGLVVVALIVLAVLKRPRPVPVMLEVDDAGIRRKVGEELSELRWDELARIQIITTDQGPFVDDVFWLFFSADGSSCIVPSQELEGRHLAHLERFQGLDYEAMIRAMGSTDNASFLVWSRDEARAPAEHAPQAPLQN
jgi:hypothetical protein